MQPLTELQLRVVTYIEQLHTRHGVFPRFKKLDLLFGEEEGWDINEFLKHPTFRLALINRGITAPYSMNTGAPEDEQYTPPKNFTREQMAAIATVINFEDRRSRSTKLKELGIPPTQWAGWMKDIAFKEYLQEVSAASLMDNVHVAHEGLLKSVDRGDVNAIKFYMEVTGRHTTDAPAMQNMKVMLTRLIESVQRHVEPATMRLIAQDFDLIMTGGVPVIETQSLEQTI
jgi:hypothetical protein